MTFDIRCYIFFTRGEIQKFMLNIIKFFSITLFLLIDVTLAAGNITTSEVEKIRKAIVTINCRISVSAYQTTGSWYGTGFMVDANKGLLVTNKHISGVGSIGTYFVTFYNGQQSEAKVIYYDQYADFAIMRIDPKELPEDATIIEFTNELPKLGAELFMIGNTEGQGFSFHTGYLSDLHEIVGDMPQASYIINMNSAGGSSGSPVLNEKSKAIGILYGGGKSHSLALKGAYVQYVLNELKANKPIPPRKHIGVMTELYSLDKAVKHRNFPKEEMKKYIKELPDSRNRAIVVRSVLPGGSAIGQLQAGDILWKVDGKKIGADLWAFDMAMNSAKSDSIKISIIRDGKEIEQEIKLYDLERNKITTILDFAGGLFFEADDFTSAKSGIAIGSVTLANVQTGGSFSTIPEMYMQDYKSIYRVQLKSLNRTSINSLNDLITVASNALKQKYINIEYVNNQPYFPSYNADKGFISTQEQLMQDIAFDSVDSKPRLFKYDEQKSEWIVEELLPN